MRQKLKPLLVAVAAAMLWYAPAQAQDSWQYELTPYLWGAGLDGTSGIGPVDTGVSLPFSDIWNNLEAAILLHFEAGKGDWALISDLVYLDLKSDVGDIATITADVEQLILEVGAARSFNNGVDLLFGVRYTDVSVAASFQNIMPGLDRDADWTDPFVGARLQGQFSEKWGYSLRGDIGGFGVGSDFTWQVNAVLAWQAWNSVAVLFAYRHLDTDFEEGSGLNRFKYDMATSGPAIGFQFRF